MVDHLERHPIAASPHRGRRNLPLRRAGRLGSPLSEEPEFWRAAPESALEWGADEFDLPPPDLSREQEEAEVVPGVGLLHASGMRL